jgi:hypothetical protein
LWKRFPRAGLEVIVGLDNQINCVDLEWGEGTLGRHYDSFHMQEDKKEEDEIAKAAGADKVLRSSNSTEQES